ncbi:uncharacterized protein LOC124290738 [Haliotis rubra]|uniref:uncharacterized protein LOC124290738 n=1 Tax=Haliotis rubra TaxID=36100 RepID=UPI001EE61978|nr:uncharacterized protein LOC124290738 [Haliotis rubra]
MRSLRRYHSLATGALIMFTFDRIVLPYFTSTLSQSSPSLGKTRVYRFNGRQMQQLHEFCTWTVRTDCVLLKTASGKTPIHIHDIVIDHSVSKDIKLKGTWESENIDLVLSELKKDPELGFMDVGAHVGAFSLSVAKFGRKVVSVDPLVENVLRLCKSIQKGGFTDRMTIFFNPLGANHSLVNFERPEEGNLGGTKVVASSGSSSPSPCHEPTDTYTITLDNTLPYLPFKKAVLKIDVENYEYFVLKGAGKFFEEIEVPAILMEWVFKKNDVNGKHLVALLSNWGYSAYEPTIGGKKLDLDRFQNWKYLDVLWKKVNV